MEKYQQHQNDLSVNASLHNQSHQCGSTCDENNCECELQELDIKPYPYLHQKSDLPDVHFESEQPASTSNSLSQHDQQYQDDKTVVYTQHQEYQSDISMTSSKACDG